MYLFLTWFAKSTEFSYLTAVSFNILLIIWHHYILPTNLKKKQRTIGQWCATTANNKRVINNFHIQVALEIDNYYILELHNISMCNRRYVSTLINIRRNCQMSDSSNSLRKTVCILARKNNHDPSWHCISEGKVCFMEYIPLRWNFLCEGSHSICQNNILLLKLRKLYMLIHIWKIQVFLDIRKSVKVSSQPIRLVIQSNIY